MKHADRIYKKLMTRPYCVDILALELNNHYAAGNYVAKKCLDCDRNAKRNAVCPYCIEAKLAEASGEKLASELHHSIRTTNELIERCKEKY